MLFLVWLALAAGGSDTERMQRRSTMQHLRLATYAINKGTFQEIADTAKTGMLPKFQEQPGFVRYGLADLGDKMCVSITVWETREQAEAASPIAATWVHENIADSIELRTSSTGDLAFFKGVAPTPNLQSVPATV
jgi:hypothetical protein